MAEKYDYREAVRNDVLRYIHEEVDLSEFDSLKQLKKYLTGKLPEVDSVTGGADGTYVPDDDAAMDNLRHNFDLLAETLESLDDYYLFSAVHAGLCDAAIRRHLLPEAVTAAVHSIEDEFNAAHEADHEAEL